MEPVHQSKSSLAAAQVVRCLELCLRIREELTQEETDPERLYRLLDELASRTSTIETLSLTGERFDGEGITQLHRLIAEVSELAQLARLRGKRLGTRIKHISKGITTLSSYQDHTHRSVAALIDQRG